VRLLLRGNCSAQAKLYVAEPDSPQFCTCCAVYRFDMWLGRWHRQAVKVAKKIVEQKTSGTLIVEKYRPRMNKLTPTERQHLRDRAMRLAFGHELEAAARPRR
jgi:hypothetical protein